MSEPIPPKGAELFGMNKRGNVCKVTDPGLFIWTYTGADRWFFADKEPPPKTGKGEK